MEFNVSNKVNNNYTDINVTMHISTYTGFYETMNNTKESKFSYV